jgi:hypothetical protein
MYVYTVIDVNPNSRLVALRDNHSRYHVAHCTSILPALGDELQGSLPERGFTLLIGLDGGACRVTFSQINCSQTWVFGVLHPLRESQAKKLTSVSRTTEVRKVAAWATDSEIEARHGGAQAAAERAQQIHQRWCGGQAD